MERPCKLLPSHPQRIINICNAKWEDKFKGINPLGWDHLTTTFIAYSVGIGIAITAFIGEKISGIISKKK